MSEPLGIRAPTLLASCSRAELNAAVLDGELVRVGDGFWWIDMPTGRRERARSLGADLHDGRVIVCDRSAAWVWGWGDAPLTLSTCVSIAARVPSPVRRRLNAREAVISPDDVATIATTPVTSPLRTVIDLLRHDPSDDVIALVSAALSRADVDVHSVLAELERRPGIAHVRRARSRLEAAISRC